MSSWTSRNVGINTRPLCAGASAGGNVAAGRPFFAYSARIAAAAAGAPAGAGFSRPSACERPPQHELDLRVQAAQVVAGPALERVQHVAVDPQQEGLALGQVGCLGYW